MTNYLSSLFKQLDFNDALNYILELVSINMKLINWPAIFRVCYFFLIALILLTLVFYVNDRAYANYRKFRIRRHQLTITNEGNTPSIFLLRPIEMPRGISIFFLANDSPMIYVVRRKKEEPKAEAEGKKGKKDKEKADKREQKDVPSGDGGLIPDLKNPMEVKKAAYNEANKVTRKAGLFASLFSGLSSLLPGKNKALESGAAQFKDVQQGITNTTSAVNSKISSMNQVTSSAQSLTKGVVPDDVKDKAASSVKSGVSEAAQEIQSHSNAQEYIESDLMIYDEKFWRDADKEKRIAELGDNYAQSRILKPGESMKIEIELRNLSSSFDQITHMYKIEVLQIPQSKLILSAPRQFINGIVSFPKISVLRQILPAWIVMALIVVVAWILALLSHLIFQ